MSTLSAPASATALNTSERNALSVLVASSAENSTSMPRDFAYSTASTALARASARSILSLYSRCMSDVAMNACTYDSPASAAASMSPLFARASPHTCAERPSLQIILTARASPSDMTGKPASMASTPSPSSMRAISTLSSGESDTPGVCSPSRSVVSKTRTLTPTRSSAARRSPCAPSPVCRTAWPAPRTPLSGRGWP